MPWMPRSAARFPGIAQLALLGVAFSAGCARDTPLAENVLLISIDTLRPDHLGCYGYGRETSPNLDALCREAVVFDQAISHAPSTLPSHASMLTALLPDHHGASFANRRPLPREVVTLAEVLKDEGYRTASFNDGAQIARKWGLDQGFDLYQVNRDDADTFDRVVHLALEWLDHEPGRESPFFLFLHTYEVHHPYTPSRENLERIQADPYDGWLGDAVEVRELNWIDEGRRSVAPADLEFIRAAYDAEIRSMDRALGRLLAGLRDRGLLESTLVVLTSDHGEEFGEHGKIGWHSHTLFDELLRVPLVVRFPAERWSDRRVQRQVRLIDLAPTVIDALAVPAPEQWQGVSLVRLLRGEEMKPLLAASKIDHERDRRVHSLRTGRWKLYRDRLYDLQRDPEELYDFSSGRLELVEALKARLAQLTAGGRVGTGEPLQLDPETVERLRALGYL